MLSKYVAKIAWKSAYLEDARMEKVGLAEYENKAWVLL